MTISCMDGKNNQNMPIIVTTIFPCVSCFNSPVLLRAAFPTRLSKLLTPSKLHRNFDFLSIVSRIIHKSFASAIYARDGYIPKKGTKHNFINNTAQMLSELSGNHAINEIT